MAAHHDISSPLLSSHRIITVRDSRSDHNPTHNGNHNHSTPRLPQNSRNPFEFLGSGGLYVPDHCTVDPFRNGTLRVEGIYEIVKIILCLPIAVARLVLFGCCLAVGFLATKIALAGWKDKHNPLPKWRSSLMWITRFSARCILFSFGYHWIRRTGRPAPRQIAPIVVSNHVSYIDPIFYFYELFPTMVASESHDSIPVVGTIIRAMQVIYVDRFSPSSRKHAVSEIKRKASSNSFPRVLLFPEGTTTNGKVLISFQLGAFIPGYAIQPVIVRYPHVHFDQCWGNISLGKLMFRMFTQFHNFMEVEYLPIISPMDSCKENPAHFAKRTSHAMAANLNVVQTSHSYGDSMLLMKACESNQDNPSSYMVEMAKVESLLHVRNLEAVDLLEKFLAMNPDSSGRVTFDDFSRAMRLGTCTLSEELFGFIDEEKIGSITFKQFLYASAHVMKLPLFPQACELVFTECDIGGENQISEKNFGDIVRRAIPNVENFQVHRLFTLFDTDGDGKVSKDNFVSCLRQNPLVIALFSPSLVHNGLLEDSNRITEGIV